MTRAVNGAISVTAISMPGTAASKLLGPRRLVDLGDRAERLCRPVELHLRCRQAIANLGSKRVEQESIQDELVAGDKRRD